MYSLVSHIAVDGASVITYRMKTRPAATAAARDGGCFSRSSTLGWAMGEKVGRPMPQRTGLVPERAPARHDHRQAPLVRRSDDFSILDRATRLDDRGDTGFRG